MTADVKIIDILTARTLFEAYVIQPNVSPETASTNGLELYLIKSKVSSVLSFSLSLVSLFLSLSSFLFLRNFPRAMNDHKIPSSIYRGTKIKQRAKESAKYAFREDSFYCEYFSCILPIPRGRISFVISRTLYIEVRYIEVSGSAMPTMTGS